MLRSAASKVMWVGRATVFLVGLAVILGLLFGAASTALAHSGVDKKLFHLGHNNPVSAASTLAGNLAGKVLQVTNSGTANGSAAIQANNKSPVSPAIRAINSGGGPALGLGVGAGEAPLTVNASAGKARNLNADKLDGKNSSDFYAAGSKVADSDKLDGKDSDEILPFVRAQKDRYPSSTWMQSTSPVTANTVSIDAPTDGFLVIVGSSSLKNHSASTDQFLILRAMLDGVETAGQAAEPLAPNENETGSYNVTVPVSAGEHTVTSEVYRSIGSGNWSFNRNNLSVMFVPQERGAVTDTEF